LGENGTPANIIVTVAGIVVVPVRGTQVSRIIVVPGTTAKHL